MKKSSDSNTPIEEVNPSPDSSAVLQIPPRTDEMNAYLDSQLFGGDHNPHGGLEGDLDGKACAQVIDPPVNPYERDGIPEDVFEAHMSERYDETCPPIDDEDSDEYDWSKGFIV